MTEHDERIENYIAAYDAVNTKPFGGQIVYEGGWYKFLTSHKSSLKEKSFRAAQLDEMIRLLEWRNTDEFREMIQNKENIDWKK